MTSIYRPGRAIEIEGMIGFERATGIVRAIGFERAIGIAGAITAEVTTPSRR